MSDIICPGCGIKTTDEDFDNGTEKCSVRTDNDWINHFECFECNHEWTSKPIGHTETKE